MLSFLKWTAIPIGIVASILLLIGLVFFITGGAKAERIFEVTPPISEIRSDSSALATGAHLTDVLSCKRCHGEQLEGAIMMDVTPFRVVAPNLTRGSGGIADTYTDQDWDRALRYGVRPSGRGMLFMPANLYHPMSDDDANDVIAYLKSIPPVDNVLPPSEMKWVGRLVAGLPGSGLFKNLRDEDDERTPVPEVGATSEYGAYLVSMTCVECHGLVLLGLEQPFPGSPPAPNLDTSASWSLEEFSKAMRDGITPDGRQLDAAMPASSYKHLNDVEMEAIYRYLGTVAEARG